MADKKSYEVLEAGFIGGQHYDAGAIVECDPAHVRWYVAPYGTRLREVAAGVKAPAPVSRPAPVRTHKPAPKAE